MYSPQPISKKPPDFLKLDNVRPQGSSQRSIPPFQSFVKSTPPPLLGTLKPLPPDPPRDNFGGRRRSSSVYSKTEARWTATPDSWSSKDSMVSDGNSIPPKHFTPMTFSTPTPRDEVLQPLIYHPQKPLAHPALSHDSGIHLHTRQSQASGVSVASMATDDSIDTTSLEEARGKAWYRGQPPMLPEEMRKQAQQDRLVRVSAFDTESLISSEALHNFHRHNEHRPSTSGYESRGRTTERQQEHVRAQYGPPSGTTPAPRPKSPSEAEHLAKMYHSILRDESLHSSRRSSDSSEEDVSAAMKMVPQPLYFNPRQISEHRVKAHEQELLHKPPPLKTSRPAWESNPFAARENMHPFSPAFPSRTDSSTSNISPMSPVSKTLPSPSTPILGRFASSDHVRLESPHLHSQKQATKETSTFAAMRDMFNPKSGMPFRRLSIHKPSIIKPSTTSQSSESKTMKKLQEQTEEMRTKLVSLAGTAKAGIIDAAQTGIINDVNEKRKERAAEKRKQELKKMIRVVPNK